MSLPTTAADALDLIVRAEQAGLDTIWLEMSGTEIDILTVLAAGATATRRVRLGTAIVPAFTRHPVTMATQAIALEGLAPGRLRLGVGTGNARRLATALGQPSDRPLGRLDEYVRILRAALHEGTVAFAGEHYSAEVQFPSPPGTPVLLAALGPTAFTLAGERTDGALAWLCPIPYLLDVARPAMEAGAQRAGRPVPPLVAHVAVAVAVAGGASDVTAAREAARRDVERYARVPVFARMFAAAGHPIDSGVSDALLDTVAVVGGEEQIGAQLTRILASGIDELMVSVVDRHDEHGDEDEDEDEDVVLGILGELARTDPVDPVPVPVPAGGADHHLATYGSLQPGEMHDDVLGDVPGVWRRGVVRGHLHDRGWAAGVGYPGIVLDPDGPAVPIAVLTSPHLPAAWPRIDAFEGEHYRRRTATVHLDDGTAVEASIYELRPEVRPDAHRSQGRPL